MVLRILVHIKLTDLWFKSGSKDQKFEINREVWVRWFQIKINYKFLLEAFIWLKNVPIYWKLKQQIKKNSQTNVNEAQ